MTAPPGSSWLELFAPSEAGPGTIQQEFRVVRRAGHPFLFLPLSARAAITALELYPAQTLKARAARAFLRLALRAGLAPGTESLAAKVSMQDSFVKFLAHAAGMTKDSAPQFAVLAGNPRAPGRRFVFLLFNDDQEPVAVVKAGGADAARKLIAHEGNFLNEFAPKFAGLPELLGQFSTERVEAFALNFIHGRTPSASSPAQLANLFSAWVDTRQAVALGELSPWKHLLGCANRDSLPAAVTALSGARVHPTLMHGDFAPWNVKAADGRWTVLDWERGEIAGIPAWDWFHFAVQPAVLVQHANPGTVAAKLEGLFAATEFQRYAEAAGIAGKERALALAYVCYCLRVTRQTEGIDQLTALEATLRARWFGIRTEVSPGRGVSR
jgi:hypothetical protein